MKESASKLLIISGVILLIVVSIVYWRRNDPNRLSFENISEVVTGEEQEFGPVFPTAIVIKDLDIKLPIVPAGKNDKYWETTDKGISLLSSSVIPGEVGNSIMYGHNWGSILKNLTKAKTGQDIKVLFSDGSIKKFEIAFTQEVTPNDTSILKNTDDRRITLYTCSGFFDSKRFVVTAIEIS